MSERGSKEAAVIKETAQRRATCCYCQQRYPLFHDDFDPDNDDEDLEDMESALPHGSVSGCTLLSRRGQRLRQEEMIAQWRSNGLPPVPNPMQSLAHRPATLNPNLSVKSYTPNTSFGASILVVHHSQLTQFFASTEWP